MLVTKHKRFVFWLVFCTMLQGTNSAWATPEGDPIAEFSVGIPKSDGDGKVARVSSSMIGTTFHMRLEAAPFPHKGAPYTNRDVLVFVPKGFTQNRQEDVDFVVFFHGYKSTPERAVRDHNLSLQLFQSQRNAILVVPLSLIHI